MRTSHHDEPQVVFMEEDDSEHFKDELDGVEYTNQEFDILGCIEVMEVRLMKRIDRIEDKLDEQNKKLTALLEALLHKDQLQTSDIYEESLQSQKPATDYDDSKYIEVPLEISEPEGDPLHQQFTPQKKRKLDGSGAAPVVVECVEVVTPETENLYEVCEQDFQEVEIELEPERQSSPSHSGRISKQPPVKVLEIPSLPIDNIEVLRGFNKTLTINKQMASEFMQVLIEFSGDDKQAAPARILSAIIGHSLLQQSTWASKSSGRLRIAALNGIITCILKAVTQAPCGGFSINYLRERVMDLLHSIKMNRSFTIVKNTNFL